jgi:transposase
VIGSTRQVRVFVFGSPADMRKGYNGLFGLVTQVMGRDVLAGDMFLFISKTRQRAKVLLWDGTGLCIYAKRLERGRFTAPWECEGNEGLEMTVSELALFLEGNKLAGKVALSPAPFKLGAPRQAA